jgi:hypothetical protein
MDWIERGGWFSSDRTEALTPPFNSGQQAFFTQMMTSIGSITSQLASRLGVDRSTALSGYSEPFKLDFKGKKDEEINAMLKSFSPRR